VIVEQRLLPKGRKRDDLRLQYDASAAHVHLQEIARLLKSAQGGHIPTVPYDPQHPKAEHLGAERYIFQWNGRHLSPEAINRLIRLVLHDVVLVDRSGERINVTSHLLRHAAATMQRQQYGVPLEILAEAMGHTLSSDGQAPEATRYYSQMTETQKTEIRHEAIVAMLDAG
jgi:integrase